MVILSALRTHPLAALGHWHFLHACSICVADAFRVRASSQIRIQIHINVLFEFQVLFVCPFRAESLHIINLEFTAEVGHHASDLDNFPIHDIRLQVILQASFTELMTAGKTEKLPFWPLFVTGVTELIPFTFLEFAIAVFTAFLIDILFSSSRFLTD